MRTISVSVSRSEAECASSVESRASSIALARKAARFFLTHNQPHLYPLGEGHIVARIFDIARPLLSNRDNRHPLEFPVPEPALARIAVSTLTALTKSLTS